MFQSVPNSTSELEEQQDRLQPESGAAPPLTLDPSWRAGRKLTEARNQRGLTLDEVAERIRVRREFLEALEEMNVKLLPGKAYALAFLRSYAQELGIPVKEIVDQFQSECALTREDVQKAVRAPTSRPRRERPWIGAALLVLLTAGFVGWQALDRRGEVAPGDTAEVSTPVEATEAAVGESERRIIEIRALSEAWLEARGPDGTVFLSRTLRAGDVYRPDPSPGWTLHARDGGAFELYVNGASAGLLGTQGMPVLGRQLDEVQPIAQAQLASPRT